MISAGHSFHDIMNEYTPGMLRLFYRASVARTQESLLDSATAARLGGATDESWRSIQSDIRRSIDKLQKTVKEASSEARRDDQSLNSFFGMITENQKGTIDQMRRKDTKNAGS